MATTTTSFASLVLLFALIVLAVYADDCVQVIYLKTGDIDKAGTDASVTLKLYDKEGYWIEKSELETGGLMEEDHDYYERDSLDLFAFKSDCLPRLPVCKIELSHDNGGDYAGWYIDYLKVTSTSSNGESSFKEFQINQWLSLADEPYSLSLTRDLCTNDNNNNKDGHNLQQI